MALPNGTGGYQLGDGNLNEVSLGVQVAPVTYTAGATLTVTDLENGMVIYNAGGANNLALPAVTGVGGVDAEISSAKVNSSFDFVLLCSGAGAATLTAGTGWTLVGSGLGVAGAGTLFRARKTGAGTYTLYRIAG
jgi:hypothetical protein